MWDCKHVDVAPKQNKAFLHRNDILISSTGTGSTGRVDIYDEDAPAITDGHVTVVRLKPTIDPYYVLAYLRCEYGRRQLLRMERGTSGQIELYAEDIQELLVPIPRNDSIIEKAQTKIKDVSEEMHIPKKILHKARSQLTQCVINMSVDEDPDYVDTAIPKPTWRIIRP